MIAFVRDVFHLLKHSCNTKRNRMELHKHLRKAREDAKLGIQQVADHLGVGRAQIWRMEKDAEFISVERLKTLADLYGKPVASFFDDRLTFGDSDIPFQLIGLAIAATEDVASSMGDRPPADRLRKATLAVIRAQQKRWADDPHRRFDPKEFRILIEQYLEESSDT